MHVGLGLAAKVFVMTPHPARMYTSSTQNRETFPPLAEQVESSLIVLNSAHTSFCMVKVRDPSEDKISKINVLTGRTLIKL